MDLGFDRQELFPDHKALGIGTATQIRCDFPDQKSVPRWFSGCNEEEGSARCGQHACPSVIVLFKTSADGYRL